MVGKVKLETPKNASMYDLICSRRKPNSFNCGSDKKNKLKGFSKSQSKNFKFEK